ncbi:MAG: hypothetical protein AAGH19_12025 [Pseudomonadota bacterium]
MPRPSEAELTLQRATLAVSDTEDSIVFSRDLLGFTVSGDAQDHTPALRTMFHSPEGATPRLVLLDAAEQQPRAPALVAAKGLDIDPDGVRLVLFELLVRDHG